MTPDGHRRIAERIERSLTRCDEDDWEIRIEAAMLAGTHWANYALHTGGVSEADEDIVHTSMLVVNTLRKYSIAEPDLIGQLEEIEELRPLFVRGDVPDGPAAGTRAVSLLAQIAGRARRVR